MTMLIISRFKWRRRWLTIEWWVRRGQLCRLACWHWDEWMICFDNQMNIYPRCRMEYCRWMCFCCYINNKFNRITIVISLLSSCFGWFIPTFYAQNILCKNECLSRIGSYRQTYNRFWNVCVWDELRGTREMKILSRMILFSLSMIIFNVRLSRRLFTFTQKH